MNAAPMPDTHQARAAWQALQISAARPFLWPQAAVHLHRGRQLRRRLVAVPAALPLAAPLDSGFVALSSWQPAEKRGFALRSDTA